MKRILSFVAVAVLGAVGFAVLFGYQALQTIVEKPRLSALRECNVVPQPLSLDARQQSSGGTQLSQFGYTIAVPWSDKQREFGNGDMTTNLVFAAGQQLALLNPAKFPDLLDRFSVMSTEQQPEERREMEKLQRLFASVGHEEFYRRLFNARPSEFSVFMSKPEAQRLKVCLVMKVSLLARHSAIYSFTDGQRRGFQLGDPKRDARCEVLLFDGSDIPVHFMVGREDGTQAPITQDDINLIIQSFRWLKDKPKVETRN